MSILYNRGKVMKFQGGGTAYSRVERSLMGAGHDVDADIENEINARYIADAGEEAAALGRLSYPNMSQIAFNNKYRELSGPGDAVAGHSGRAGALASAVGNAFPTTAIDAEIDAMNGLDDGFLGGTGGEAAPEDAVVVTPGGGGGASGGSGGASPQRAAEQVAANKEAKKIAAIKRLQINNGVTPTGVMDQDTLDSINTVREEQKALNKLNPEFKLVLDGNRGRKTKGAAERMANPATSVGNITATPEASAAPELAPISIGDEQAARIERQAVRAGNQLSRQEERANRQAARQGRRAERQLVRQGNRANRQEFRDENPGFLKRFMSK